ncbi:hypothetical protein CIB48_g6533 [Xylaria polymorpha]|nr:hypothetical protein CIB48_g6533 [Xylaria polymorpha]
MMPLLLQTHLTDTATAPCSVANHTLSVRVRFRRETEVDSVVDLPSACIPPRKTFWPRSGFKSGVRTILFPLGNPLVTLSRASYLAIRSCDRVEVAGASGGRHNSARLLVPSSQRLRFNVCDAERSLKATTFRKQVKADVMRAENIGFGLVVFGAHRRCQGPSNFDAYLALRVEDKKIVTETSKILSENAESLSNDIIQATPVRYELPAATQAVQLEVKLGNYV